MKQLLASIALNSLSIFLTSLLFSGLQVTGGITSFITAGLLLTLLIALLDPIVKIITLPFNIITLGLLSFLSTLAALFVLTFFYSSIKVYPFIFDGISFLGLTIKEMEFSLLLSFIVISATIYFVNKLLGFILEQ